jgi:HlyD family secretion protein
VTDISIFAPSQLKLRWHSVTRAAATIWAEASGWLRSGEDGMRSLLAITFAGGIILLLVVGVWGATAPLAGAVIAPATVVVDSNVKKIQHQTGGIVGEILVRDGQRVEAGDLLVRLDQTMARANLLIVTRQLDQIGGRQARLKAERDGLSTIAFPSALTDRQAQPDIAEIVFEEQRLFENRRSAREGQRAQLTERVTQLSNEIDGLTAQLAAKEREISLIREELKGVRELYRKNLVQLPRLNALERDAARIEGERGQLLASVAQTKGKIAETKLQILQIDQDLRTEVGKDLRELQAKEAELAERRVAAEDQLQRVEIRSPQAGMVHQLAVHTVGGVVTPGEPIMLIVPEGDTLVLEAKIAPQDIDHIALGQPAVIRLSAFNQRTTPEVNGRVSFVSADLTKEQQTNSTYYVARISIEDDLTRLTGIKLLPGMPAEVHLQTGERTALSYMLKPLRDQFARAFKEK